MNTKKKLLSITNLKKYFPVAKKSIFQKEQLYVKANEEISLDIHEGETIGIVGESGCGKSTLGRVLLQLYPQTAGQSIYYGRSLEEVAPKYVKKTLTKFDKYLRAYHKAVAHYEECSKKVEEAGGEETANFFDIQNVNLAKAAVETAVSNAASVAGGLFAVEDESIRKEGLKLLLQEYEHNVIVQKISEKLAVYKSEEEFLETEDVDEKKKAKHDKKLASVKSKIVELGNSIKKAKEKALSYKEAYDGFKSQFKGNEEFEKYEAKRDGGVDLARLKYEEIRKLRKDLQIIFQDPYSSLNPRMTVGQIIEEGLTTHHYYKHGSKALKQYILDTMEKCGLQDFMIHRYPHQFSGGQRQRICIARALALKPKFVVCDECVSALDVSIQSQIINLLDELKEKDNLTYLFISHDLSVVKYISDKIGVMYLGNMVEYSTTNEIFDDPRHPYTIALLSSIPTTDIDSLSKERIILEGNIPSPIRPPHGCKFHTRCYMATDKCNRVPPELKEVKPGHFVACHYTQKKVDEKGNFLFKVQTQAHKEVK